jgi:hypothetical protein
MLGALLLGARQRAFARRQSKTTARAKMKLPRMARARMTKIFLCDAVSGTRLQRRHPRALLRRSVRFLQRFEFF